MHLNGCKERGTNYNEQEGSVRYDEFKSMNREELAVKERMRVMMPLLIINHNPSLKTLYMWARVVGSAIGNLRPDWRIIIQMLVCSPMKTICEYEYEL